MYFVKQFSTSINSPLFSGFNRTHMRVGIEEDALVFDATIVPPDSNKEQGNLYLGELITIGSEEDDIFSFDYLKQFLESEIEKIGPQTTWSQASRERMPVY